MTEYFAIGITFACISILYNLVNARYFVPTLNKAIYKEYKKSIKSEETLTTIIQLLNVNTNISVFGLMFAWVLCWPALLLFKAIKLIVWILKLIIDASKTES